MSFNLEKLVRLISGENAVINNVSELKKFGEKCLIVTSGTAAVKSGALSDVKAALEKGNIRYEIFGRITENPKTADCFEAGEKAREFGADFITGIGGGSPLDAAKAIAVYASNPQIDSPDLIYSLPVENKPLPVVLIGTTAGTGSEVTGVSVLTNCQGKKKSVKGENYYAALVFADPKYTYSLPFSVTVSTALDALCHATESFFSARANGESEYYSKVALPYIWDELTKLKNTRNLPDNDARERLYDGSLFAGAAINITGCCFPHTVGYYLTEKHGVSHGRACAVFLPDFVRRAMNCMPEKAEKYLNWLGTDIDAFEKTVLSLADIKIDLNEKELENYLPNWEKAANFDNSPGGYSKEDAQKLIEKLFL
ncbi:MAG: iron-containing alcohol dehydrogenase [Clostridiales bacterium]|nr:iron-containing alcohol dehydrogenase [Clostridiales bacterium]